MHGGQIACIVLISLGLFFYNVLTHKIDIEDKYHVLAVNYDSRGRSNQLLSIVEELLFNDNDQKKEKNYFVTFLVTNVSFTYLDEFVIRYPKKENVYKYQIIMTQTKFIQKDVDTFMALIQTMTTLYLGPFDIQFPFLQHYLKKANQSVPQDIDIHYEQNVMFPNFDSEVIFKPIDMALMDTMNYPLFTLTSIYNIPTVGVETLLMFPHDSSHYLSQLPVLSSQGLFADDASYPHSGYNSRTKGMLIGFILRELISNMYIGYKYNYILSNKYKVPPKYKIISTMSEVHGNAFILQSMGPPVSNKNTFSSARTRYTGFLLSKHLDENEPLLNNVTIKFYKDRFNLDIINDLYKWMNDKENIIYIAFGTLVSADKTYLSFSEYLLKFVFTKSFLSRYNYHVLWAIKPEIKSKINVSEFEDDRILFKSWLPQKELLHHKNIKLFITHGGTSSIKEALYAGKPLLFTAFNFPERYSNAIRIKAADCGDIIDKNFNFSDIQKQISELIINPIHSEKCGNLKEMMMVYGGTQTAVKMIKYVRKFGIEHLIPIHSNELSWYQESFMDIYIIFVLIFGVLFFFCPKCIRCIICCGKRPKKIHYKNE